MSCYILNKKWRNNHYQTSQSHSLATCSSIQKLDNDCDVDAIELKIGHFFQLCKVGTISFERPVNYLYDAWHVFLPKYEAGTHFNRPWTEYQMRGSRLNIADHINWICQSINMSVILSHI